MSLSVLRNNLAICFIGLAILATSFAAEAWSQSDWAKQMAGINANIPAPFSIDEQRVAALGIRKISSDHLVLYTDAPKDPKVDELPEVFDQCIEQWCDYFEINPRKAANWKMRCFLISDESAMDKFDKAGLKPADLPFFRAGFQRSHNIWMYDHPGNYYTRHLLIHEGTHGFMQWFLNGYGPPWYSEGMAELLGVHRWANNRLKIGYDLKDRSEADYWGRVKRIKDERGTANAMTLSDVFNIPPSAYRDVRYYGWSWAGCEFLGKHELSKNDFRKLFKNAHLGTAQFNQRLMRNLKDDWPQLQRDWELFISEIDYGFEVDRGRVHAASTAIKLSPSQSKLKIRSDRSWQMTRIEVEKGDRFKITGKGRFTIGSSATSKGDIPWPCESNGITIEYHNGRPLGVLLAGVLAKDSKDISSQVKGLLNPVAIGNQGELTATTDGHLCLRINESPARLNDNDGTLEVVIEKLK